jgi:hypothetical protein
LGNVSGFTVAAERAPYQSHGAGWTALATRRENMSKSNDTPKLRELRDDELQEVSGGWIFSDVMVESVQIVSPRDPASGLPTGKRSVF